MIPARGPVGKVSVTFVVDCPVCTIIERWLHM